MSELRTSAARDVPAIRELWKLAFGDSEGYIDNFFETYYRPERVLALEDGGTVQSMAAWFDTVFVVPGRGEYRSAYLYAVATRPECRGKGYSSRLLAWADGYFRSLGIPAVTTVPAEPSLHEFFGRNGFRECFRLAQGPMGSELLEPRGENPLRPASPAEYKTVRDTILSDYPHPYVKYPEDALAYQAGCCALGGGGLYVGETAKGPVCLCAEGDGQGTMLFKELLGGFAPEVLPWLPKLFPSERQLYRSAPPRKPGSECVWKFGMLKWLDPPAERGWNWDTVGYLGLAFD